MAAAFKKLKEEIVGFRNCGEVACVVGDQDPVELGVVFVVDVCGDFGKGGVGLFCCSDVSDDVGEIGLLMFLCSSFEEGEVKVAVVW